MDATISIVTAVEPNARQQAFAVREAVFVIEQKVPLAQEFDDLDESSEHLLALIDGRVVGTTRLRMIDENISKIERVAVLEEARGFGVGAALIDAALARLRDRGCAEIKLHAQTHALGFYERFGFVAFGEAFDEDGIAHRAMSIRLDPGRPQAGTRAGHGFVKVESGEKR